MFEKIVVRPQDPSSLSDPIDLGFLAEAMLFYGEITLVAGRPVIQQLLRTGGPDTLIALLEGQHLRIVVPENFAGIFAKETASGARYGSALAEIRAHPRGGPLGIERSIVAEDFVTVVGRSGRGRRLARRVAGMVSTTRIHERVADQMKADLRDSGFLSSAARDILTLVAPEYTPPADVAFVLEDDGTGSFALRTNIDFDRANAAYRIRVRPEHSTLNASYLLSLITAAREVADGAAALDAELACDPVTAQLIQRRVTDIVERRATSSDAVHQFVAFNLDDGRAIREAVNSGSRSLQDLIALLNRAREFRKWLASKSADTALVQAYFKEVTKDTWVDRLPTRIVRWALFTGAGVALDLLGAGGVGTVTGVGLGATDTFLLDRIIKGWRPNQFVNGPLKDFVGESS